MKFLSSGIFKTAVLIFTVCLCFINCENVSFILICFLTLVDVALCVVVIYSSGAISIKNPAFLFWIVTLIFSLGQNLAYLFIIDREALSSSLLYPYKYSAAKMNFGSVYTIQAFNLFTIGLFGRTARGKCEPNISQSIARKKSTDETALAKSGYLFGTLAFILGAVPQLMYLKVSLVQYFNGGYGDTAADQLSGLVLRLHYLFLPAVFVKYVSKIKLNKNTLFDQSVILSQVAAFLLMGDRGTGLAVFVTYIWIKAVTDENFKLKKYIIPCVAVILCIPLIKYYRIFFSRGDASAFSGALTYIFNNNPIVDLLLETGSSQRIIIMTAKKVSLEGFAGGRAYLDFFIKMIPSNFGIKQNYGTLAKWVLNTTSHQSYGFTVWAEAYLNFGKWGIPFMYIIGFLFGKMFSCSEKPDVFQLMRVSVILYFFADIARRSISEFGYNFLYDMVIPLIVIYVAADLFKDKKLLYGVGESNEQIEKT